MYKKIIAAALIGILAFGFNVTAFSAAAYPKTEDIEKGITMEELVGDTSSIDEMQAHFAKISGDKLLLMLAQAAYSVEQGEMDEHIFMLLLPEIISRPEEITENDYINMLKNPDYNDTFKLMLLECGRSRLNIDNRRNSVEYNSALREAAKDTANSEELRISAVCEITDKSPETKALLTAMIDEFSGFYNVKGMMDNLEWIAKVYTPEEFKQVRESYKQGQKTIRRLPFEHMAGSLQRADGGAAGLVILVGRNIIETTSDKEVARKCMYAFSRLGSEEARSIVRELKNTIPLMR